MNSCFRRKGFLDEIGVYFSPADLKMKSNLSSNIVAQCLNEWLERGWIEKVWRGWYRKVRAHTIYGPHLHYLQYVGGDGYITGHGGLFLSVPGRDRNAIYEMVISKGKSRVFKFCDITLELHNVSSVLMKSGIEKIEDGGRVIRFATPERVIVDGLFYPDRFMKMEEVFEIFLMKRRYFKLNLLLELTMSFRSETLRKRMLVFSHILGLKRLHGWLREVAPFSPQGVIKMCPSREDEGNAGRVHNVVLNFCLADLKKRYPHKIFL